MLAAVSAFLGGTGGAPPASASPSPNARKRAQPDDDQNEEGGAGAVASQRPRLMGGFLGDDSDDSDNDDAPGHHAGTAALDKGKQPVRPAALSGTPPPAKKRMLAPPAQADAVMEEEDDEDEVAAAAAAFELPPAYRHPFAPAVPSQRHDAPIPIVDNNDVNDDVNDDEQHRYDLLFGAARESMLLESETRPLRIQTCGGQSIPVRQRCTRAALPYEAMVAARSRTKDGRAARSFYGIAIHELVDGARKELAEQKAAQKQAAAEAEAAAEIAAKERAAAAAAAAGAAAAGAAAAGVDRPLQGTQEGVVVGGGSSSSSSSKKKQQLAGGRLKKKRDRASMLWTEKYRARSFLDLVGDDLTNRLVLRWLKRWDPLVFPHAARAAPLRRRTGGGNDSSKTGSGNGGDHDDGHGEKAHHKILILAGPPGLGKTTLAHVCARQAGYEVLEINASDERSRDVVNGRIRTSLGTESVKTVEHTTEKKSTAATAAAAKTGPSSASSLLGGAAAHEAKPSSAAGKVARPVCVVVDEVDGVVGGSSSAGGEGGFVKALIDLVLLDQKNTGGGGGGGQWQSTTTTTHRKKKGDDFRQMRPLILICNDVYHPALRPLRQSGLAEIVHVGKPSVEAVVARIKGIFEKEGIACEKEAARKLCEAAWGMTAGGSGSRPRRGGAGAESTADGDLRSVLVVGEWVARRLRATATAAPMPQLTRFWVDKHVLPDLAYGAPGGGGVGARGLGRGGTREIVMRVFQEGAGFPQNGRGGGGGGAYTASLVAASAAASATAATRTYRHEQPKQVQAMSFAEHHQRHALARLREMVETSGDVERIVTDVFATFPRRAFHDDAYLTKPDAAYEWLHFHDACAHRVFASQEWELAPYTSLPVLALHQLFGGRGAEEEVDDGAATATAADPDAAPAATAASPLAGPRADFAAREAEKQHLAALQALQARLPPSLLRAFRSPGDVAADLLPYVVRLVSPDVKPVLINVASGGGDSKGGRPSGPTAVASVRRAGEKALVRRAAEVLAELGIRLRRGLLEEDGPSSSFPGRPQWVYRMDPDLDLLASFETARHLPLGGSSNTSSTASAASSSQPTRYAVRQVLDQELRRTLAQRDNAARQARFQAGRPSGGDNADPAQQKRVATQQQLLLQQRLTAGADKENQPVGGIAGGKAPLQQQQPVGRRDFFGRLIEGDATPAAKTTTSKTGAAPATDANGAEDIHVWVTYHEGLNNAVRKPISVEEFLRGL